MYDPTLNFYKIRELTWFDEKKPYYFHNRIIRLPNKQPFLVSAVYSNPAGAYYYGVLNTLTYPDPA